MGEIERMLEVGAGDGRREDFRREVISRIGAWSLDHLGRKPDYEQIFPRPIAELREAFFGDRKKQVRKINEDLLVYLVDGPAKMPADAAEASQEDPGHAEDPLRLLRPLRQGRGPGAGAQALQLSGRQRRLGRPAGRRPCRARRGRSWCGRRRRARRAGRRAGRPR